MHRSEVAALRAQLRALKPRLRKNMELQAERDRDALMRQRDDHTHEKKTLLREAQRGTAALRDASQMMRQVRMRETRVVGRRIYLMCRENRSASACRPRWR